MNDQQEDAMVELLAVRHKVRSELGARYKEVIGPWQQTVSGVARNMSISMLAAAKLIVQEEPDKAAQMCAIAAAVELVDPTK